MAVRESGRRGPPYVAYRTWETLLVRLRQEAWPNLPERLDSSVWAGWNFSGSTQSALKGALVFLGLTTPDYCPTEVMAELVGAHDVDAERRQILHRLVIDRYSPVLRELDLANATRLGMREAFQIAGSGTRTSDKAVSFFVALAQDAGSIELSNQLKMRTRSSRSQRGAGGPKNEPNGKSLAKISENNAELGQVAHAYETKKILHPLVQALVDELPAQDEQWPVEKKQMFFDLWAASMTYLYGGPGSMAVDT